MGQYPDYVKKFRPKGTVVKKVNGQYYVYEAHSERVPGKKYPVQKIDGLKGKIDTWGFHETKRKVIDMTDCRIREYGFTNYLLLFKDLYMMNNNIAGRKKKETEKIYDSIIVYLSNNSYLADKEYYDSKTMAEKYNVGIPNQITAIQKLIKRPLEEIEELKYICVLISNGNKIYGKITKKQEELLREIGVEINELQR